MVGAGVEPPNSISFKNNAASHRDATDRETIAPATVAFANSDHITLLDTITDASIATNLNTHVDANSNPDRDSHANSDIDTNTNPNPDRDPHAKSDVDAETNTDADASTNGCAPSDRASDLNASAVAIFRAIAKSTAG